MNCKPGDLARIIHPREYGRIVTVLYAAPSGEDFTLPDGQKHKAIPPGGWVCEAAGEGFVARVWIRDGQTTTRVAKYVCIYDEYLRPIRDPGDDARDETLEWLTVPNKQTEAA